LKIKEIARNLPPTSTHQRIPMIICHGTYTCSQHCNTGLRITRWMAQISPSTLDAGHHGCSKQWESGVGERDGKGWPEKGGWRGVKEKQKRALEEG
jgi:hypothetical protein